MTDTFLLACLSFLIGIALRSVVKIPSFPIYLLALIVLVPIFLANKKSRQYFIAGLFLFLGLLWYNLLLPVIDQNHLAYYNSQTIEFTGIVSEEPNKKENTTQYVLSAKEIKNIAAKNDKAETARRAVSALRKIKGRVLIIIRLYPEYKYGDLLQVSCLLQKPEPISLTPQSIGGLNSKDFRYDQYLAAKNIYSFCLYPQITKVAEAQGNIIKAGILRLKENFLDILNQIYTEPEASLLSGLLLGGKRSMPVDLKEAFTKSGVIHIVAISGYNISIIIKVLAGIFPFFYLSRKKSWPLLILGIGFFVILTGAESSVVRAAVMGLISALASAGGRLSQAGRVLIIAALIMAAVNPHVLIFDAGFQLSFLATIGLIYVNPLLSEIISKFLIWAKRQKDNSKLKTQKLKPQLKTQNFICLDYIFNICQSFLLKIPGAIKRIVAESFTNTLAATIMTLPLILYQFGRLSLVSILANVLILGVIPAVMLLGFISILSGFGSLMLGRLLAWPAWLLLFYIISITFYLAAWPIAQISVDWFSLPWLIISYVLIFWAIIWSRRRFGKEM